MFGKWKLQDFDPGQGEAAGAHRADFDHSAWIDVAVPGDVHQALMAAGRIEDPFYDRNEEACAWMEDKEWWYRTALLGPQDELAAGERQQLVFDGLDTYATVWLNGVELGRHRNMFRPAVFDVSDTLLPGKANTLALRFAPAAGSTGGLRRQPLVARRGAARRHAQGAVRIWLGLGAAPAHASAFGAGWSCASSSRAALTGVHFYTVEIDPTGAQAVVAVHVEIERLAPGVVLSAQARLMDGERVAAQGEPAFAGNGATGAATLYLTVAEPRLWWTHDLGEPHLYTLHVELFADGELVDQDVLEAGIRTIELDQSPDPDEPGTRFFRFVLNGVPIFAKGAELDPGALVRGRPARRRAISIC